MLKFHTSPFCKRIQLRPSTDCTQKDLEWYLSGLPPARRRIIISFFIIFYDSELPYCCGKQWRFGVLPRRHTNENFVKLGHTMWITCQRSRIEKALDVGASCGSQQDGCISSAYLPRYWTWVCYHFLLMLANKIRFSFICFSTGVILHFPYCREPFIQCRWFTH